MTGWQVIGWALIAAVCTVIEGFALGFALSTVKAFTHTEGSGPVHIFRGRNDQ